MKISAEKLERIAAQIRSAGRLREVCAEIEQLQKVVFHNLESADWSRSGRVAEQILIADILTRQQGEPGRIEQDLKNREQKTGSPQRAVQECASYIHSYFTTPLGIMMRRELFGDAATFLAPEALEWIEGRETPGGLA